MKLYSITNPDGGCDPESDDYTLYREMPNEPGVREWEVADDGVPLFALCKRTARCCGTGHLFESISDDRAFVQAQAAVLCGLHTAPLTDSDYYRQQDAVEDGQTYTPPKSYFALPVEVIDRFEPYEPHNPAWDSDLDAALDYLDGLSEDAFTDFLDNA